MIRNSCVLCNFMRALVIFAYDRFKDGIEIENFGTNGSLTLSFLSLNKAGRYWCSAETEAGVSQSDEAVLVVKGTYMYASVIDVFS